MREKKSVQELEDLVRVRLGMHDLGVKVLWDKIYGWNAFPVPTPPDVTDVNARIQCAVEELRKEFELKTSATERLNAYSA